MRLYIKLSTIELTQRHPCQIPYVLLCVVLYDSVLTNWRDQYVSASSLILDVWGKKWLENLYHTVHKQKCYQGTNLGRVRIGGSGSRVLLMAAVGLNAC